MSTPNEKQFPLNLSTAEAQNRPLQSRLPADFRRYPTPVYKRGNDIVCPLAVATAFGGPLDRGDNGETASGVYTNRPGGVEGVALPMPQFRGCIGTPLPRIPWFRPVEVMIGNRVEQFEIIDGGPSGGLKSQAIIDLTLEAWEKLLGTKLEPGMVNTLQRHVSFIIVGGVKYLGDYVPHGYVAPDEQ